MSDDALRQAWRVWQSNPADPEAYQAAINAYRRAGEATPPPLLDAEVLAPRTFTANWDFAAKALLPTATRESDPGGSICRWIEAVELEGSRAVEIPSAKHWWVRPRKLGKQLAKVYASLADEPDVGLSFEDAGRLQAADLDPLPGLSSLRALVLRGCRRVDVASALRAAPASLRYLDLGECAWPLDPQLDEFKRLTHLTQLSLGILGGGEGLEALSKSATRLTHLNLLAPRLRNEDFQWLRGFEWLEELDLSNTRFSNAGVRHLEALPRLRRLCLYGSGMITDKGIAQLCKSCPRLTHLDLSFVDYARSALQALCRLEDLKHVNLSGCNVPWDVLEVLSELPHLERIDLPRDIKLPAPEVARRRFPRCELRDLRGDHGAWAASLPPCEGGAGKEEGPG